jgi:RHS repeat-associated protein
MSHVPIVQAVKPNNTLLSAIGKEAGGATSRLQEQTSYGYDGAGNLNQRTNNGLVHSFNVNNLNELTTETNSGTVTVAGTTTVPVASVTVNGLTANHYADATFALGGFSLVSGLNTYTAVGQDSAGNLSTNTVTMNVLGTNSYQYDLNGNLTNDGTRRFAYDDENELIAVWLTNGWSNSFAYDGKMRRRVERDYTYSGSSWVKTNEVRFIYDGDAIVEERDTNSNPLVSYTRGSGGLLARTSYGQEITVWGTNAYYHSDGNGNVRAMIFANQQMAARYEYDSFGNMLAMSGPLARLNRYRFAGKEWNNSAGLYYFGRRFYDPMLQRFINRDPMGEGGGFNLYAYCANDPIAFIDVLGYDCDGFWSTFFNGVGNDFERVGSDLWQLGLEGDDIVGYGEASLGGYGDEFDGYSDLFQNIYNNSAAYNADQMQANILGGTLNAEGNVATLGLLGIGEGTYQAATTGNYNSLQDNFAFMALGASAYGLLGSGGAAAEAGVPAEFAPAEAPTAAPAAAAPVEAPAAEGEMATVTHFTDEAGMQAISQSGTVGAPGLQPPFVTLPSQIPAGSTAAQVEQILEIQPGRGQYSITFQTPSANLMTPFNGPTTSGNAIQFQLINPALINPANFIKTP